MSESTDKPGETLAVRPVPPREIPEPGGPQPVPAPGGVASSVLPLADPLSGLLASLPHPGIERGILTATVAHPQAAAAARPSVPRPALVGAPVLIAQAIVPGLGYALLRRPLRGAVTLVMFVLLVLIAYWQFPKNAKSVGVAWVESSLLVGLVWLSLLLRTARDLRIAAAVSRGGDSDSAEARRLARAQRQGLANWLVAQNWLMVTLLVFGINHLAIDAEVDFAIFFKSSNLHAAQRLASGLFHPKWSITGEIIQKYAWVSLEMAILGTVGGALLAAPFSFLAARNLMGRNPVTRPIYYVMRFFFSCVRAIPTLIWGLIAISFTLGHFPGVIALSIFSFGLLAKLYSEAIEAIDWGQIEAVTAAGANPLQVIVFAVVPQVVPYFISHTLYSLEVNVHSAVVLGLIGAGGIGLVINEFIGTFHWSEASMVLIITIVMTLAIDYGSAFIRSRVV